MKFCKDCKYHSKDRLSLIDECTAPPVRVDPINGKPKYRLCIIERMNYDKHRCGPEGKLFEQRPLKWYERIFK
jgi:hypothetical protein